MNEQEFATRARQLCRERALPPEPKLPTAAETVAGIIGFMAAKADAGAERETEYMGDDGLLHCRICGGPRQTIITPPFEGAKPRTVRCWCGCPTAEDRRLETERRDKIERLRRACFRGTDMRGWSFANDDRRRPELSGAMAKYAAEFREHLLDGNGLLLYGNVGTGKTYFAACVANAVIEQGYSARMTNFTDISNDLWGAEDKAVYMEELRRFDLLILDDLGAERKNEYMQEIVYNVIDARYRAGKPVIVTTNLSQDELAKPAEIGYGRIYDRILERCLPVKVDGHSRRRQDAGKNWGDMRRRLGMEV